jgi:hypothetical protein
MLVPVFDSQCWRKYSLNFCPQPFTSPAALPFFSIKKKAKILLTGLVREDSVITLIILSQVCYEYNNSSRKMPMLFFIIN